MNIAVITGASSGLGEQFALKTDKQYPEIEEIWLIARREDKLKSLSEKLSKKAKIISLDITDSEAMKKYSLLLNEEKPNIKLLINNAGFGVFGDFTETDLDSELRMIDTNVKAVHILTKLVVKKFKARGYGHILNVASLAAFFPGPLFASYYATKSYVLRLSQAIYEELRKEGSKVKISVLCPGPVATEFGDVAKVNFGLGNERGKRFIVLTSHDVSEYAINKMFAGKLVIIPGTLMKIAAFLRRIIPDKIMSRLVCLIQHKKCITK